MADFAAWIEKNRGLWSRVYDEVIAPDIENEWKKREDEHQSELKQRDENQQLLFNHINEQIVKNARLVEENERLEVELQQRAESAAPPSTAPENTATSTNVTEDPQRELVEKYDELSKKYQDLSQKAKYLEKKNNAVLQKNRDMKEVMHQWKQYSDRLKAKEQAKATATDPERASNRSTVPHTEEVAPNMSSSPRSVNTARTPLHQTRSSPAPGVALADLDCEDEAVPDDEVPSPSASVTPRGPSAASTFKQHGAACDVSADNANAVPGSSQTTVDEPADQTNQQIEDLDVENDEDWPEVVSERSLKRKRGQQSRIDTHAGRYSDGTPAKPHRVKDEPLSSPPPAAHVLLRTETIDLDDTVPSGTGAFDTLRRTHSTATGTIRHQRSGSAPFSQVKKEQTGRVLISDVQAKLQIAADEMRALSEPSGPRMEDRILQPIDPNVVTQSPDRSMSKRLKQGGSRSLGHTVLAESGETPPPTDENELRLPPSVARARLQRMRATRDPQTPASRLQRTPVTGSPLVKQEQVPSPPRPSSRPMQTPSVASGSRRSAANARLEEDEIVPDGRPVWSMRAPDKRPTPRRSNPSPSAGQVRLRDKPVHELRAHDFKPNPVYNNGYTYAFSEAVRKRGDRLCLPGCTNEQCCGSHFRRLAEALGPLSAAEEEALLENYLGDAYTTVISTQMSSDERAELILQARTKKMAKDSGKHREAYERHRTPPGFWRVDFPTTQEQEEDRCRARELEVRAVQERWLEAHKKGGRWMFRDEPY